VDNFLTSLETQLKAAGQENCDTLLEVKKEYCQETETEFDGKLNAWETYLYQLLQQLTLESQVWRRC
jgi:predicted HicB family RNase H-like nuclease